MPSERQMTPAPWLPPWPTSTTDGLISAAMSAMASESASPARAGMTKDVPVSSRSRIMVIANVSALFGLALALADGDRDLAWFSAAGDADRDALANAIPSKLLLKLLDLADRHPVHGKDDVAEHQPS